MATPRPNIISSFFLFTILIVLNPCPQSAAVDPTAAYSVSNASTDYGNIVHEVPSKVIQPSSVSEIIDLIRLSSYNTINTTVSPNMTVAARGHGHSVRGQAMTVGAVVNMTALSNPARDDDVAIGSCPNGQRYVDVLGGDLWIDVLNRTVEKGFAPVSWIDYLHLTVGGTLSNAGISGQAFARGPQIANVLELDVVTGKGENLTCSPSVNSELFLGALGGLGQFGIITRARILVEKAPKMTRWVRLMYTNFSLFTQDQERLISFNTSNTAAANYVEGFVLINASATIDLWKFSFDLSNTFQSDIDSLLKNHTVLYSIEVAKYYDDQNSNEYNGFETLIESLNFTRGLVLSRELTFFDFLNRLGDLDTVSLGSNLQHPWLNLMIPKSNVSDFNRLVLVGKIPELKTTPGLYIFYPLNKNKWNDNMSAVTPSEDVFYTLGMLHSTPDNYTYFDTFNNDVLSICKNEGIQLTHYLPNFKTKQDWVVHFGQKWSNFSKRKTLFDPKYILSPGQRIFNN